MQNTRIFSPFHFAPFSIDLCNFLHFNRFANFVIQKEIQPTYILRSFARSFIHLTFESRGLLRVHRTRRRSLDESSHDTRSNVLSHCKICTTIIVDDDRKRRRIQLFGASPRILTIIHVILTSGGGGRGGKCDRSYFTIAIPPGVVYDPYLFTIHRLPNSIQASTSPGTLSPEK